MIRRDPFSFATFDIIPVSGEEGLRPMKSNHSVRVQSESTRSFLILGHSDPMKATRKTCYLQQQAFRNGRPSRHRPETRVSSRQCFSPIKMPSCICAPCRGSHGATGCCPYSMGRILEATSLPALRAEVYAPPSCASSTMLIRRKCHALRWFPNPVWIHGELRESFKVGWLSLGGSGDSAVSTERTRLC